VNITGTGYTYAKGGMAAVAATWEPGTARVRHDRDECGDKRQ
jgi:hypothetical protein